MKWKQNQHKNIKEQQNIPFYQKKEGKVLKDKTGTLSSSTFNPVANVSFIHEDDAPSEEEILKQRRQMYTKSLDQTFSKRMRYQGNQEHIDKKKVTLVRKSGVKKFQHTKVQLSQWDNERKEKGKDTPAIWRRTGFSPLKNEQTKK